MLSWSVRMGHLHTCGPSYLALHPLNHVSVCQYHVALPPPSPLSLDKGGVLEVNAENDPELFSMAKVGLGCLGVVTELTLKVIML